MLQILVNVLHEALLGFNKSTKYIDVEIKELDCCIWDYDCVFTQIFQIWEILPYLGERLTWKDAIVDWFANRTSKFSKTKAANFLWMLSVMQSCLLQMVLSKAFQMSMMFAVVYYRSWTCYVVQVRVINALICTISFFMAYWRTVAGSSHQW